MTQHRAVTKRPCNLKELQRLFSDKVVFPGWEESLSVTATLRRATQSANTIQSSRR
jgi:hypothetical protein